MNESRFAAAFAAGKAMTVEQAVADVLEGGLPEEIA